MGIASCASLAEGHILWHMLVDGYPTFRNPTHVAQQLKCLT